MVTKQSIIKAANYKSKYFGTIGGFVNLDEPWLRCRTAREFAEYIESLGFTVVSFKSTGYSLAIVDTKEGYRIAYNGNCTLI